MADQSRTPSEWEKCGHCGFPMHPGDTVRYFGKYHAHLEARCRDLMRERISTLELEAADLRERLAKARELMEEAAGRIETCEEIISDTSGRSYDRTLIDELHALAHPKGADHE